MTLKNEFELKEIAGSFVVFPVGQQAIDFHGMLSLNETGAFLWNKLKDGADKQTLVDAICTEYDIDCDTASADIDAFLQKLDSIGCLITD